jgi:C4-dicarboxylate-specific signal transduction histidine kinase
LLEEAISINQISVDRHRVKLIRKFERIGQVPTDKHKLLQVLVNLLTNAKDAVKKRSDDREVTIYLGIDEAAPEYVRIAVQDNGVGIPEDNLTRIFTHGFTTKKKGHGFGLHSAALTVKEIGGILTVESDGPDRGAIFAIQLPLERESTR